MLVSGCEKKYSNVVLFGFLVVEVFTFCLWAVMISLICCTVKSVGTYQAYLHLTSENSMDIAMKLMAFERLF